MIGKDGLLSCVDCGVRACSDKPGERKAPMFCPMTTEPQSLHDAEEAVLQQDGLRTLAVAAARTANAGSSRWTRVEEIVDFSKRIGAKRLGLAFCGALAQEARLARDIFTSHDLEVCTVMCGVGSFDADKIDPRQKVGRCPQDYRVLCNPVGQAAVLAKAGCQFNIVMGLCLGHDSLFLMHSKVPTTVLIVKDRVLGHNPAAALYTSHSYYKRLLKSRD